MTPNVASLVLACSLTAFYSSEKNAWHVLSSSYFWGSWSIERKEGKTTHDIFSLPFPLTSPPGLRKDIGNGNLTHVKGLYFKTTEIHVATNVAQW